MLNLQVTPQQFQVIWNALMSAQAGAVFEVATELKRQVEIAETPSKVVAVSVQGVSHD